MTKEININDIKKKPKRNIFLWIFSIVGAINWLYGAYLGFTKDQYTHLIVGGFILLMAYAELEFKKLKNQIEGLK